MSAVTDTAPVPESLFCREVVAKNSKIPAGLVRLGYIYVIGLNVVILFHDNVPISLQAISTAMTCIILGSFSSLRHPDSLEAQDVERMKPKDAYMFPVFGSVALCSFYVIIRYLPKWCVDIGIQGFFVFMSAIAGQALFDELAELFLPSIVHSVASTHLFTLCIRYKLLIALPMGSDKKIYIPIPSLVSPSTTVRQTAGTDVIEVKVLNLMTLLMGSGVAYLWWAWEQHWFCNNLIGISLSIQAISFLNPGSYYTAAVLLALLFFYDIFWVFGTDVMVTVAKDLKAPIKLIFPRPAVVERPNMLGLGDIVLPGIYIALLLRYDVMRTYSNINFKKITKEGLNALPPLNIRTFYFSLFWYFVALASCLISMWYFNAAQPALLYICPALIFPVMVMAYFRGDFQLLWQYDEEPENESNKKKD